MSERTEAVLATFMAIDHTLRTAHADDLAGQGAALAQMLTLWLMRHPKRERAVVLDLHLIGVRDSLARREREEG
jgi:hypothetical protein